jgi:hypothetical protein
MSADASGNLSVSGDNTFTTSQPVVNPPNISGVSSGSITSTGAIVTWSTDVNSTSQVEYGTSTAYGTMTTLDSTLVTSHSQTIGSLTAGTLYHYRVRSADGSGNLGVSSDFTFTTLASPVISGVASGSITTTGATVTWTTNTPTTSHVEYGTTAAYGYSTQLDPALVTSHSQTLSALQPGTTYHYRVDSSDSGGSVASSADNTFVTAQAPAPPPTSGPVISNVTTGSVTNSGAVISWSSNIPSTSQLEFGSSSNYGFADQPDSSMATVHSHKLTGLQPGTLYHFRVDSTDGSGNLNLSNDFTFSTGGQPFPTHPSSPNLFRK